MIGRIGQGSAGDEHGHRDASREGTEVLGEMVHGSVSLFRGATAVAA